MEWKKNDIDNKRVCSGFSSHSPQEEGVKFATFRESGDAVSDGELADRASVSVLFLCLGLCVCVFACVFG